MTLGHVSMDQGHWANRLNNASRYGTDQLRNIHEIVDINRPGREQWRKRYWTMQKMRKISRGRNCFVPDAFPYTEEELAREKQDDENHTNTITWSCSGLHPP